MSRSYGKSFSKGFTYRKRDNKRFRSRCRSHIQKEMASHEFGSAAFPLHKKFLIASNGKRCIFKGEIRKGFCLGIRHVLNGHSDRGGPAMDEAFIEAVNEIKGASTGDGRFKWLKWLEWLQDRKIRAAIKAWAGDPFESLMYLAHRGFIERAVRREFKLQAAK